MPPPSKPPLQFSLASLLLVMAGIAFLVWLRREYWLIYGPLQGMLLLAWDAVGVVVCYPIVRWVYKVILRWYHSMRSPDQALPTARKSCSGNH